MDETSRRRAEQAAGDRRGRRRAARSACSSAARCDIGKRLFGGPDPETVASSALQSMRAQNRLVPFVARYVSVVSSRQERFGGLVSSERDADPAWSMSAMSSTSPSSSPRMSQWDAGSSTLSVTLPEIEIAGPDSRSRRGARIWRGRSAVAP